MADSTSAAIGAASARHVDALEQRRRAVASQFGEQSAVAVGAERRMGWRRRSGSQCRDFVVVVFAGDELRSPAFRRFAGSVPR